MAMVAGPEEPRSRTGEVRIYDPVMRAAVLGFGGAVTAGLATLGAGQRNPNFGPSARLATTIIAEVVAALFGLYTLYMTRRLGVSVRPGYVRFYRRFRWCEVPIGEVAWLDIAPVWPWAARLGMRDGSVFLVPGLAAAARRRGRGYRRAIKRLHRVAGACQANGQWDAEIRVR